VGTAVLRYSLLGRALQFKGMGLAVIGRLVDAKASLHESLALSRARSEPESVAWTLSFIVQLAWLAGEDEDLIGAASEAVTIAEDTGNVAVLVAALDGMTLAHLARRDPMAALTVGQRALAEARKHRSGRFEEARVLAHLAHARLGAGDREGAASAAGEAVAVARSQEARVVECLALLSRAQVSRAAGTTDAAKADLRLAFGLIGETGALGYEPFIHEELGRICNDDNELREALRLYRKIGATGHARRLEGEFAGAPP
jgi:ATP/maltotriose-dependent transcriptional regulator MalT